MSVHRWLHIRLEAPLMAFGGVAIDQVGPTRDLPAASALTGLLANALGWHWHDRDSHQALQDRLVFGALAARGGILLSDTQNARLEKSDKGWTTWGTPASRGGNSYTAPHRRQRDYLADAQVHVLLRLEPAGGEPTLEDLAHALDHPARPLFIGRKPCLPTRPLMAGWVEAETALAALKTCGAHIAPDGGAALWPVDEGNTPGEQEQSLPDIRNWHSGVHAGTRRITRGRLT